LKAWTESLLKESEIKKSISQYLSERYTDRGSKIAAIIDEIEANTHRIEKAADASSNIDYLASLVSKLRAIR